MVNSHEIKNPPSIYTEGDEVMVKIPLGGKKIKGKKKLINRGLVLERRGNRYKVQYEKPSNGTTKVDWFPVSAVTSCTRHQESLRQAKVAEKNVRGTFKTNFHLLNDETENAKIPQETNEEEQKKIYSLRRRRVSSYKGFDGEYQQYQRDLRKAMDESRRYHAPDTSQLVNLLSARGLRIVDVPGDGDCFYYAVAHQIFGDISKHTEIRANAVEYVANHPDDFQDFLENGEIDCYLSSLVRDREWADNLAIQATANAYGVIIEVINSNQDQFTGSRVVTPTVNQDTRRIVLGQIEQLHFVSTEIDTPFTISPWGGEMDDTSDILTNTCPLDGPLLWLMSTIHTFSKVKEFIEQQKMCNILV